MSHMNQGFGAGFSQGWGLADSYLDRQNVRKRQKFEDDRRAEQTLYDRGRDEINDARQVVADQQSKSRFDQETAANKMSIDEAKRLERLRLKQQSMVDNLKIGERKGFIKQNSATGQVDFTVTAESLDWAKLMGVMPDWERFGEDPARSMREFSLVEEAIRTGQYGPGTIEAFNHIAAPLIAQRPDTVENPDMVVDGKSAVGWKIKGRKVVDAKASPDGKGIALEFEVTVVDPQTGEEHTYLAPATNGGDDTPNAQVSTFTPEQILQLVGMQRTSIMDVARSPEFAKLFAGHQEANMALHGDAIKNREAAKAEIAKATTARRKDAIQKQEAYRKWTDSMMPVTGDDKAGNTRKRAAYDASLDLIGDVLTRAIPNYKMDPANLTASQQNMIYGDFSSNYDNNKYKGSGFFDFRNKGADNTMLLSLAKDLLKQVPEAKKKVILDKIKAEMKTQSSGADSGLGGAKTVKQRQKDAFNSLKGMNSIELLRVKNGVVNTHNTTAGHK